MPSGWFSSDPPFSGHPFVLGSIRIPRLGVAGLVEFLVDTGCGLTTLHPADSLDMRVDFNRLTQQGFVAGIGGNQPAFSEEAELSFFHDQGLVTYILEIDIAPVTEHNAWLPSLLGMDVIRHWRMVCDVQNGELSFEVHHADDVRGMDTP